MVSSSRDHVDVSNQCARKAFVNRSLIFDFYFMRLARPTDSNSIRKLLTFGRSDVFLLRCSVVDLFSPAEIVRSAFNSANKVDDSSSLPPFRTRSSSAHADS